MQGMNKYKFVGAVICLFLLPFLILSRHFIFGNKELQKNYTLRYLEMRTLYGSRMIADALDTRYNLSRIAGGKKFLQDGVPGRKAALEKKVNEAPFIYSELVVLSPSGRELVRASAEKKKETLFDYSKSPVFAEAKKTGLASGAVEYGDYTPPALILAEPAGASGSRPEYYLAGRLSLAYLGEMIRLMGRNSHGNMGLVDAGRQVIADSLSISTVRPGISAPAEIGKILAMALEKETPNFAREITGQKRSYLVSVSNVPGSKWWFYEIMDTVSMPAYTAPFHAVRIVASGALIIVLFGIVTYVLALRWLRSAGEDEP